MTLVNLLIKVTKMDCSFCMTIKEWIYKCLPTFHESGFTDVTHNLLELAGWSGLLGVILAIVIFIILILLSRKRKGWMSNLSGKSLTKWFVFVWFAGFILYDVGMFIGHSPWSLLTNAPMAIIHAFEMFVLESDVAAIHAPFHDNAWFMLCFSLVHITAAFITLVFVIKHFGYNIVAGFRMMCEAYGCKKKETYVLWGLNEVSYFLAKSIKEHYGNKKGYRIVVVRTNHENGTTSVKNGMERLFNFLSIKNNDFNRLIDLDCLTTSTYTNLAHVHLDTDNQTENPDILRKQMDLNRLARIIAKKTSGKLHLFFLSDYTNENIQAVANLKQDATIVKYATGSNKALLYCNARYNSVHRVIEDEQTHDNIEVKVVDTSHISVELLKQDARLQPVSFVDIEKDATVSSAFKALVIGFGEVGYDAVRFLYEFGSFVKTGSTGEQRSDFHCDVVDKNIMEQAGLFYVNAPSVSSHMSYNEDHPSVESLITLHDMDCKGVEFYRRVEKWIEKLNYVVIALDDDVENVSLAVRIFRLAVRYRKDLNHFRILVRVRNDEDGHLLKIVRHYNRLWAAETHSEDAKRTHQRTIAINQPVDEPITMFGSLASTFTYDYIISDKLTDEAKKFKERYDRSIKALHQEDETAQSEVLDWENEHRDLMQLTKDYKGFAPTYSGITRLRRIQRQNRENCFHLHTKLMLAREALGEQGMELLTGNFLSRKENETTYQWNGHEPDSAVERVLEVLAQTEHMRWVASHEILGYHDDGTEDMKDEARLLHGCLKPWKELSTRIQSYDYNVVDVSLGIM